MKTCGAKTRSGHPCKRAPMANGRCRLHGGLSTGAPLKHGRRSKFLPKGLKELYLDLDKDAELATLTEDIRTTEAMILETLAQMRDQSGASWAEARKLYEAGDAAGLRDLFDRGQGTEQLEAKYERLTLQKSRLVAVDSRRQAMNESNLNARQANALVATLIAAINDEQEEISPHVRARIREKLVRLLSSSADR